jgi:bifunctional non-homologous end joining protein LigD
VAARPSSAPPATSAWRASSPKRLDSSYLAGRRSDAWRKVKPAQGQELVVGGWLPGAGRLEGVSAQLLVGYHDDDGTLRYAGRVGSGLDETARARLEQLAGATVRDTSPFANPPKLKASTWVEPRVVVEVAFHEWTRTGVLRAPRYKGVRTDKDASEVVREIG